MSAADERWVGTWATAAQPALGEPASYRNQTLRLVIHTSIGGDAVRVRLSNVFGSAPVEIGGVEIALRDDGADVEEVTSRHVTRSGQRTFAIGAGESVLTDPAEFEIPALSDLAVSLLLPRPTKAETDHFLALQTNFVLPGPTPITTWPFLTAVEVRTASPTTAIVVLGDSFTDGAASTQDTNRRWPDLLAARLQARESTRHLGVLNAGIIGNRLTSDSPLGRAFHGPAGVARFERDALDHAGVGYVIVQLGLNDIGFPGSVTPIDERVSADDLIAACRQLIERGREQGVRVIGSTISPFADAISAEGFHTEEKDHVRHAFNAWVRTAGEFHGIVDVDEALRDAAVPSRLRSAFDSGDHMHPNDAGHQAITESVDLALFERSLAEMSPATES